jgi:hypothetical protein
MGAEYYAPELGKQVYHGIVKNTMKTAGVDVIIPLYTARCRGRPPGRPKMWAHNEERDES